MRNHIAEYDAIMERYHSGEFGTESLSMHDILDQAGAPDLIRKMVCNELEYLAERSSGMTKMLFIEALHTHEKEDY